LKTPKTLLLVAALICVALLAGGCKPASPAALSNEEVKLVTENILVSINEGDYQSFIKDYSEEMKTASTEPAFGELRTFLLENSGNFVNCATEPDLSNQEKFAVYVFECEFEKEMVRVTRGFRN
jgi:hypothetical protein